jgi:hypothetical protein
MSKRNRISINQNKFILFSSFHKSFDKNKNQKGKILEIIYNNDASERWYIGFKGIIGSDRFW